MITRMSTLFLRTLREDPADAEVPSHRLLVRAGYVRRAAPGIYTWLPLGLKVLRNVEKIVREEMDAAGSQEVSFPALLPREPYEASGRWTDYGDNVFRLKDRKGGDYLLGPTHEEMFTLLVKDLYSSYKQLPLSIYQIQTKYRDEARPRAGILRGREFVMKDAYSFDIDDAGLDAAYQQTARGLPADLRPAGFEYVIVSAMCGAMGGSASEEFLAISAGRRGHLRPQRERRLRRQCRGGGDAVAGPRSPSTTCRRRTSRTPRTRRPSRPWSTTSTRRSRATTGRGPRRRHAEERARPAAPPRRRTEPLAVGVPGDREVDAKRLEAQVSPAEVEAFDEAQFAKHPALVKGYIGPGALGADNAVQDPLPGRPGRRLRHQLGDRRGPARPARHRPRRRP